MPDEPPKRANFTTLYHSTVAPLRRYLTRLLGDSNEAQDIAHDAYLRVYPKVEDHTAQKPEALLYTTARRLAFNRLKRRKIAPFIAGEANLEIAASPQPGIPQQVMARQEYQQLEQAIAQLPEGCRAVLLLRKVELLSHREIADQLGIAISTVEKQHARALRLLRTALAATNAALSSPDLPLSRPETRS